MRCYLRLACDCRVRHPSRITATKHQTTPAHINHSPATQKMQIREDETVFLDFATAKSIKETYIDFAHRSLNIASTCQSRFPCFALR